MLAAAASLISCDTHADLAGELGAGRRGIHHTSQLDRGFVKAVLHMPQSNQPSTTNHTNRCRCHRKGKEQEGERGRPHRICREARLGAVLFAEGEGACPRVVYLLSAARMVSVGYLAARVDPADQGLFCERRDSAQCRICAKTDGHFGLYVL